MRSDLGLVHGMELLPGLALNNHARLNEQVRAEAAFELDLIVDHGNRLFLLDAEAELFQLVRQTNPVGRFEQSRSKSSMYFDRRTDDGGREIIQCHGNSPLNAEDAESAERKTAASVLSAFSAFKRLIGIRAALACCPQ